MIDIVTAMSTGTNVHPTLSSINECRDERGLAPITGWQAFIAYMVASYTVEMTDTTSLIPPDGSPITDVFGGVAAFREAGRPVVEVGGMEEEEFVQNLQDSFIQRIEGPPSLTDLTDGFATGLYVLFVALLKRAEQC
jgi:hypothetical protein